MVRYCSFYLFIFELVLDPITVYTYSGKNTGAEPLLYKNLMDKGKCPYKRYVRLSKFSTVSQD